MVSKTKFKAQALQYFRQVERTGQEVVITDRGRPVLRLVPYETRSSEDVLESLRGTRKTIDVASAAGTAHVSAISCTSAEVTQALEEYAELLRRMGRFEEAGALAARIVSGGG